MKNQTEPVENFATEKEITKTDIITVLAVFLLTIFIIALFLLNKATWENKLVMAQTMEKTEAKMPEKNEKPDNAENNVMVDKALLEAQKEEANETAEAKQTDNETANELLRAEIDKLKHENKALKTADSLRMNAFGSMASYKIYALYKEKEAKQTTQEIAKKFNIKSEKAIKTAEINGEKAYIIPVKGIHIAKSGDTAFSIAKKYYKNEKQAKIIEDFNGEIKAGQTVFLPFVN
jgi:LysM repeat protein